MDENKQAELRRIGYVVPRSCGLCVHGDFPKDDWGTCAARVYEHKKHTGPARHLSIYRLGSCPDKFEPDHARIAVLGAYAEFVPSNGV